MASFGETLRRERELRGVSLREIADSTKISVRFLQALEQDRIEVLPGGVFRRAFVREYARHLGLDDDRVVAEFMYAHGDQEKDKSSAGGARDGTHPGAVLLVALFAIGAVLSVVKASQDRQTVTSPEAAVSVNPPRERVPAAPAAPTVARLAVIPDREQLVITLSARQTCWVEARVDGQVVMNRVLQEGQSERLQAEGEIVLSVGNAGGLSFTVNDLPGVSLGRSGEVRRNIVITKKSLPSFVEESSRVRASHSS